MNIREVKSPPRPLVPFASLKGMQLFLSDGDLCLKLRADSCSFAKFSDGSFPCFTMPEAALVEPVNGDLTWWRD